MKICLLSARFPQQRCGVGDYTYFLASALARSGHTIDVLTCKAEPDDSLYPLSAGIRVHRVVGSWRIWELRNVIRHIRKLDPQVLVIQYTPHSFDHRGMTIAVNLLPALLRFRGGVRIVTNFHELFISFDRSLRRSLGALWQRIAAILLASGSHAITVTAIEWQRLLKRMGIRKRIQAIPVGSNIPQVTINETDRVLLRARFISTDGGLLLVGFGDVRDRDVAAAFNALRQFKTQRAAKLLWIGGSNRDKRYPAVVEHLMAVNGLKEEDVYWTGHLPHPEVSRILSVCDVAILPFIDGVSTRRTTAVTVLQHGLPLLTTQNTRVEPWFVHRENAYMVPVGDTRALADGLVELASNPELRSRLARGARALYEAQFAWDGIAKEVARVAHSEQNP
jgi:glycosyltransferase involved in cell wall biosynthesis